MNIRIKRNLLMKESIELQSLKFDKKLEHKDENKSKIINKQDELYKKWTYLNQLAYSTDDYKIGREIKEKEDEFYKRYLFYKNYSEALKKVSEIQGGNNKKKN